MSGYSFEISGIDELINQIERTRINFPRDLQKLIEKHGGKLLRDTKMKTPVDTGQLRRSWELEKGDLYIKIYNNTSYAQFIEWGHRTKGGKSYVEGVYMLKTSFEKTKKNFEEDLENLFKKYGFK
jgi:hypothetical protein